MFVCLFFSFLFCWFAEVKTVFLLESQRCFQGCPHKMAPRIVLPLYKMAAVANTTSHIYQKLIYFPLWIHPRMISVGSKGLVESKSQCFACIRSASLLRKLLKSFFFFGFRKLKRVREPSGEVTLLWADKKTSLLEHAGFQRHHIGYF